MAYLLLGAGELTFGLVTALALVPQQGFQIRSVPCLLCATRLLGGLKGPPNQRSALP